MPRLAPEIVALLGLADRMIAPVNADVLYERIAGCALVTLPAGRDRFFEEFWSSNSATVSEFIDYE